MHTLFSNVLVVGFLLVLHESFFILFPVQIYAFIMERLDELLAELRQNRMAMENQIKAVHDEFAKIKDELATSVAKKVKRTAPQEFRRKGNEKQFRFNEEVSERMEDVRKSLFPLRFTQMQSGSTFRSGLWIELKRRSRKVRRSMTKGRR